MIFAAGVSKTCLGSLPHFYSCPVQQEDADCAQCPNLGNLTIHCTSTELHLPAGYMVRALGCSSDLSAVVWCDAHLTQRWTSITPWPPISLLGTGAPTRWPLVRQIVGERLASLVTCCCGSLGCDQLRPAAAATSMPAASLASARRRGWRRI